MKKVIVMGWMLVAGMALNATAQTTNSTTGSGSTGTTGSGTTGTYYNRGTDHKGFRVASQGGTHVCAVSRRCGNGAG